MQYLVKYFLSLKSGISCGFLKCCYRQLNNMERFLYLLRMGTDYKTGNIVSIALLEMFFLIGIN